MERSRDVPSSKQTLRARGLAARRAQESRETVSREICRRLAALREYQAAGTVMFYVNMPQEVDTRHFLPIARQQGKRIVIPHCRGGRIELFRWEDMEELEPSPFGVLEPKPELCQRADRAIAPRDIDLVVVPGVAFDPHGGRLGHGKGYYDGLLTQMRPGTPFVALAFQCQMVSAIPVEPHDVFMHKVITERTVYEGRGWPPHSPNVIDG
jgi:5-formyltetrahydrofolate cyclo-ligase